MAETKYASYKGRVYVVKYKGEKAGKTIIRLASQDGSIEFWAKDGEPVTPCEAPAPLTRTRRKNWQPCGYPGCTPQYCDECDGEGYRPGR